MHTNIPDAAKSAIPRRTDPDAAPIDLDTDGREGAPHGRLAPCSGRNGGAAFVRRRSRCIPPQWVWHYLVLHACREWLLEHHAGPAPETAEHAAPGATIAPRNSVAQGCRSAGAGNSLQGGDALYEVESAMHRILTGDYGFCEVTGEQIPGARLRELPWTRYTREAAEQLERANPTRLSISPRLLIKLSSDATEGRADCACCSA